MDTCSHSLIGDGQCGGLLWQPHSYFPWLALGVAPGKRTVAASQSLSTHLRHVQGMACLALRAALATWMANRRTCEVSIDQPRCPSNGSPLGAALRYGTRLHHGRGACLTLRRPRIRRQAHPPCGALQAEFSQPFNGKAVPGGHSISSTPSSSSTGPG